MTRRLWHCLAVFLLILLFTGLPVQAQQPPAQPPAPAAPPPVIERPAPSLQYTVAAGCLIVLLVIVCMPSRKG